MLCKSWRTLKFARKPPHNTVKYVVILIISIFIISHDVHSSRLEFTVFYGATPYRTEEFTDKSVPSTARFNYEDG
jgi:hypothetical protein